MKRGVIIAIVVFIVVISILIFRYFAKPNIEEISVLRTDESAYLNWDLVCTEPWDELIINQTELSESNQALHSISFYEEGNLIKTVKIPKTIVFWKDENEVITVFKAQKNEAVFLYQGERHLSSQYTYGLFEITTIGDGFFAKCYMYQNNGNNKEALNNTSRPIFFDQLMDLQ